jgi:hypothetical protein
MHSRSFADEAISPAHFDIPVGEPELVAALLHPKSRRSIIGRMIDWAYHKQPRDVRSVAVSVNEAATSNK